MATLRIQRSAILGLYLIGTGCLSYPSGGGEALEEEGPIGTHESAISSTNRLSMNHLSANFLSLNELSTDRLSMNGTTLAPTSLLFTKNGREVLDYLIRCALPSGTSLKGTVAGKTYEYEGLIGLAPEWVSQALGPSGQRWVTACMLAHVNAYGIEVPISLRGNAPALSTIPGESVQYPMEEMSFYGNMFTSAGGSPALYACAGKIQQTTCLANTGNYEAFRACDPNKPCLITTPGACRDITLSITDSCESTELDWYSGCHDNARMRTDPWPAAEEDYAEVITVYMHPDDFNKFYGHACGLKISISLGL